ncbi:MAG TPA: secretin N-terminal domain-containing protein [Phycisphaerae bacterium]|nr:secretin N-terminal domain-containing protein [Phycisphaerae bacterium]HRY68106.1 secretin N-terminal domain-containing protein [Phycisphaerae bacterium]HSA28811.1 secretin N-terminal domain-containing protein [Phycisphaerae bacterium]
MKSRFVTRLSFALVFVALLAVPGFTQQLVPAPSPAAPPQAVPAPKPPSVPAPPAPPPAAGEPLAIPSGMTPAPLGGDEPLMVRIYALKHARAEEVAKTITRTAFGRSPLMAVPDSRTNAVILNATADRLEVVEELIKELDKPVHEAAADRLCQVVALRNTRADELVKVLQGVVPDATFSADRVSNRLLFSGNAASQALVQQIVTQLDREQPADGPQQGRKVRVVWLVSNSELPPPPPDMNDVVNELASMGITRLGLAAQSLVQAVSGGKFSIQCSPAAFTGCRLRIEGGLQESKNEPPRVELVLNATGALPTQSLPPPPPQPVPPTPMPPPTSAQLASITTTVMAEPGHKVVLGVAPIEKYASVFVIQILPGSSLK